MAENKKKHAGHGYHKTEIVHHADGSHTTTHHVHPDHAHEMKDKSYATADHDGMLDGMMDNTSQENLGEAEADGKQRWMRCLDVHRIPSIEPHDLRDPLAHLCLAPAPCPDA